MLVTIPSPVLCRGTAAQNRSACSCSSPDSQLGSSRDAHVQNKQNTGTGALHTHSTETATETQPPKRLVRILRPKTWRSCSQEELASHTNDTAMYAVPGEKNSLDFTGGELPREQDGRYPFCWCVVRRRVNLSDGQQQQQQYRADLCAHLNMRAAAVPSFV